MRALGVALLGAISCACSSPELYQSNRNLLDQALASLEAGEYERCVRTADSLVERTAEEAGEYQLQRFFAAHAAVRAHVLASFHGSFLHEPRNTHMTLGDAPREVGSPVAHMVAAARRAGVGLGWKKHVGDPAAQTLEQQLPPFYAALGAEGAASDLNFCLLSIYARLGFEDRLSDILSGNPDLIDLERCEVLMEGACVAPEVRPWVRWLVFRYLRTKDEPRAYKFAVKTLFGGGANSVGEAVEKDVREWITTGSSYEYTCPSCKAIANPTISVCVQDSLTALIDFVATRKEPRGGESGRR